MLDRSARLDTAYRKLFESRRLRRGSAERGDFRSSWARRFGFGAGREGRSVRDLPPLEMRARSDSGERASSTRGRGGEQNLASRGNEQRGERIRERDGKRARLFIGGKEVGERRRTGSIRVGGKEIRGSGESRRGSIQLNSRTERHGGSLGVHAGIVGGDLGVGVSAGTAGGLIIEGAIGPAPVGSGVTYTSYSYPGISPGVYIDWPTYYGPYWYGHRCGYSLGFGLGFGVVYGCLYGLCDPWWGWAYCYPRYHYRHYYCRPWWGLPVYRSYYWDSGVFYDDVYVTEQTTIIVDRADDPPAPPAVELDAGRQHICDGWNALREGDAELSAREFYAASLDFPESPLVLLLSGSALASGGELELAAAAFEEAFANSADTVRYRWNAARFLGGERAGPDLIEELRERAVQHPDRTSTWVVLASIALLTDDLQTARRAAGEAVFYAAHSALAAAIMAEVQRVEEGRDPPPGLEGDPAIHAWLADPSCEALATLPLVRSATR